MGSYLSSVYLCVCEIITNTNFSYVGTYTQMANQAGVADRASRKDVPTSGPPVADIGSSPPPPPAAGPSRLAPELLN